MWQVKAHLAAKNIAVRPADTESKSSSTAAASGQCRCGPGCACKDGSCGCANGACGCSAAVCPSAAEGRQAVTTRLALLALLATGVAIGVAMARR